MTTLGLPSKLFDALSKKNYIHVIISFLCKLNPFPLGLLEGKEFREKIGGLKFEMRGWYPNE
jgi:hypothetical protein